MIPGWLRRLLNICKKQPEPQDKPTISKNFVSSQQPSNYRNPQSINRGDEGIAYTTGVITGASLQPIVNPGYVGLYGGGSSCGGGNDGGHGDGGCDGGDGGCDGGDGGGCGGGGCGGGCGGD